MHLLGNPQRSNPLYFSPMLVISADHAAIWFAHSKKKLQKKMQTKVGVILDHFDSKAEAEERETLSIDSKKKRQMTFSVSDGLNLLLSPTCQLTLLVFGIDPSGMAALLERN